MRTIQELRKQLKMELPALEDQGDGKLSTYLGTVQTLDPCGRYHHVLSPNGATTECERFWANLEAAAASLNAWTEAGDSDGCDIFLCMSGGQSDGSK